MYTCRWFLQPGFLHEAQAHVGLVERIEVDAGRAFIEQAADLAHGEAQAGLTHGFHAAFLISFFQFQIEFAGDVGPAEAQHAAQGVEALDGQDAGDDRRGEALRPQAAHQFHIFADIEKELRHHEIRARGDLFGQMMPVRREGGGLGMRAGVPGHGHAHVRHLPPDEAHEIQGMAEAPGLPVPVRLIRWRVAAQGQHVLHAIGPQVVQEAEDALLFRAHAGQMGHDLEAAPDELRRDGQGVLLLAAARAVGHRGKERIDRLEAGRRVVKGRQLRRVGRREEFEGNEGLAAFTQQAADGRHGCAPFNGE